jgi:hypothetical protein
MSITRVFPIFAAAFALVYVICVEANWALVTYHPRINEWEWLTKPAKASGPAMYWYGWLATSFLAASAISLLALPLTRRWSPPVWIGWAVPLAVMVVFVYLLRSFFLRWPM